MKKKNKDKKSQKSVKSGEERKTEGKGRGKDGRFQKHNTFTRRGAKNKFTTLKDSFVDAFKDIEDSKEDLFQWASQSTNRKFFYLMISKMLPTKMEATIKTDYRKVLADELERRKELAKFNVRTKK